MKYAEEESEVVALEQVFEGEIFNAATKHPPARSCLKGKVDGIVKRGGEVSCRGYLPRWSDRVCEPDGLPFLCRKTGEGCHA